MAIKLGEALIKGGLITTKNLRLALERQVIFGGRTGTNLVETQGNQRVRTRLFFKPVS